MEQQSPRLRRVVVIGTAGSGKTTFAQDLARRTGCDHIELDALHWEAHWTQAPVPVFRSRVEAALHGERWIVDGNYSKVRDLVWSRADTLVWLDYPLPLTLLRLIRRTVRRVARHEQLWNGNRERLLTQFASRDSLFLWAITTHGRHTREFESLLAGPDYSHLQVARLRSTRAANRWLQQIVPSAAPSLAEPNGP